MLGILFIYFIGKYFYQLAEKFHKNKWLFAIIGVVAYYAGTAIGGVILGFLALLFDFAVDWDNQLLMTIIAIPFGFSSCYILYFILNRKWKSEVVEIESIEDIGIDKV